MARFPWARVPWAAFPCWLVLAVCPQDQDESRRLTPLDLERVRELHRLTDLYGEQLWPGYDAREIPIAINCDDQQELLVSHPRPPGEFREDPEFAADGISVLVRDGCTKFGPRGGGGWAIPLGDVQTAYMSVVEPESTTESWLSTLLHEGFHVFQRRLAGMALGLQRDLPQLDADYCAGIALESHLLDAALRAEERYDLERLGREFVSARRVRRADLSEVDIATEDFQEFLEGTPTYVQARLLELLVEDDNFESELTAADPQYSGFADAREQLAGMMSALVPPNSTHVTFFHSQYRNGMAQCLLLDRVRPDWKEEFGTETVSLFELVERAFPLTDEVVLELRLEAEERCDYPSLRAAQQAHVDELRGTIDSFVNAKGLRIRVVHRDAPGHFRWKPLGPVYNIPEAESPDVYFGASRARVVGRGVSIWGGGFETFEKEGLTFRSTEGAVIFGPAVFDWVQPETELGPKDVQVTAESDDGEARVGLRILGPGFELQAARAALSWEGAVLVVRPIGETAGR